MVLPEDHYLLKLHQIDPANDNSRADGEAEARMPQPIAGRAGVPGPVRDGRRNSRAVQAPLRWPASGAQPPVSAVMMSQTRSGGSVQVASPTDSSTLCTRGSAVVMACGQTQIRCSSASRRAAAM